MYCGIGFVIGWIIGKFLSKISREIESFDRFFNE